MPKNVSPPFCYICGKNYKNSVDKLHYCICDISVCVDCVNSVKISNNSWVCPKCKAENDIGKSRLFRTT